MSTQSWQLTSSPRRIRCFLNRRAIRAASFGSPAIMASTTNGGVAETHDRAVPVKAIASLAFASSEEQ